MHTHKIGNHEFFAKESGDHVIRTQVPKDQCTDELIRDAVHRANVPVGDSIRVQCVDKSANPTKLFWERQYKIVARDDFLQQTPQPDDSFKYAEGHRIGLKPLGPWWQGVDDGVEAKDELSDEMTFEWNVGRKGYEVKSGDMVVGFTADRDLAEKMAAREAPLKGA